MSFLSEALVVELPHVGERALTISRMGGFDSRYFLTDIIHFVVVVTVQHLTINVARIYNCSRVKGIDKNHISLLVYTRADMAHLRKYVPFQIPEGSTEDNDVGLDELNLTPYVGSIFFDMNVKRLASVLAPPAAFRIFI